MKKYPVVILFLLLCSGGLFSAATPDDTSTDETVKRRLLLQVLHTSSQTETYLTKRDRHDSEVHSLPSTEEKEQAFYLSEKAHEGANCQFDLLLGYCAELIAIATPPSSTPQSSNDQEQLESRIPQAPPPQTSEEATSSQKPDLPKNNFLMMPPTHYAVGFLACKTTECVLIRATKGSLPQGVAEHLAAFGVYTALRYSNGGSLVESAAKVGAREVILAGCSYASQRVMPELAEAVSDCLDNWWGTPFLGIVPRVFVDFVIRMATKE